MGGISVRREVDVERSEPKQSEDLPQTGAGAGTGSGAVRVHLHNVMRM